MNRPIQAVALAGYKIRLTYADGVTGVLDLSDTIGKGIFGPLKEDALFKKVYIGDQGQIARSDEIEICPDAAYLEIAEQGSPSTVHA